MPDVVRAAGSRRARPPSRARAGPGSTRPRARSRRRRPGRARGPARRAAGAGSPRPTPGPGPGSILRRGRRRPGHGVRPSAPANLAPDQLARARRTSAAVTPTASRKAGLGIGVVIGRNVAPSGADLEIADRVRRHAATAARAPEPGARWSVASSGRRRACASAGSNGDRAATGSATEAPADAGHGDDREAVALDRVAEDRPHARLARRHAPPSARRSRRSGCRRPSCARAAIARFEIGHGR